MAGIKQQRVGARPWTIQKDNKASEAPDIFSIYISPADEPGDSSRVVRARVSEDIQLSLSNDYGALFDSSNDNPLGKIAQLGTGRSLVVQEASRQIWKGASGGSFSFELTFIAHKDPRTEVVDKIKQLYKLATPAKKQSGEGLQARIEGALLIPPGLVNIDIPNVLSLTNFHILEVNFAQTMKLMRSMIEGGISDTSLPMRANGSIMIAPQYMFLKDDIDFVFLGGTNEK